MERARNCPPLRSGRIRDPREKDQNSLTGAGSALRSAPALARVLEVDVDMGIADVLKFRLFYGGVSAWMILLWLAGVSTS